MIRRISFVIAVMMGAALAQTDGPNNPLNDSLLDNMVGNWALTGKIAGLDAVHEVTADWVLNHQFLRIHERDPKPSTPGARKPYEAMIFVGYDNAEKKYVVHWLDVFGGHFSARAYGTRDGDAIKFVFEYPDGPFHTTFTWKPESRTWNWYMEQKDQRGQWKTFGDMTLMKR
jgi:hypothetical protein